MTIRLVGTLPAPHAVQANGVDRGYGLCGCWLCKGQRVPETDQAWMLDTLARDLLRKDDASRALWLTHWTHRHGGGAAARLRKHIQEAQRQAGAVYRGEHAKGEGYVFVS